MELEAGDTNQASSLAGLIPLSDADVSEMAQAMRQKALATDQRILVSERLGGHSLTCRQAGVLLQTIKLGLMQRILAFEVLQGRLSDLPDGLPYVLEPLAGNILRKDVEVGLQNPQQSSSSRGNFMDKYNNSSSSSSNLAISGNHRATPVKSFNSRPSSPTISLGSGGSLLDNRKPGWEVSVNRLRARVKNGDVAPEVYEDLNHVFEALGLGPLQPARELSSVIPSGGLPDIRERASTTGHLSNYSANTTADILQDLSLPGAPMRPSSAKSQISEESV